MLEPVRVRDLLHRGVPLRTLNTRLPKPFWGIRAAEVDFSISARARQFSPRLGPGAFHSHATAAQLWGIPMPPWIREDMRLHVSFPAGHRAPDARMIVGHELQVAPRDTELLDGLPTASPARIVRDLAPVLGLADLVAVIDTMLHRGLVNQEQLLRMAQVPGFRGRRKVIAALALADGAAESPPETLLRVASIDAGLPELLVNVELRDRSGRFVARPDLRFRNYPVVMEYDGDGHRTSSAQWQKDVSRFAAIEDLGFDVIRALSSDLPHFRATIARARRRLSHHGWRP